MTIQAVAAEIEYVETDTSHLVCNDGSMAIRWIAFETH